MPNQKKKRSKRLPRHQFEGIVTWMKKRYPPNGDRDNGKLIQIGIGFESEIPESVLKQAKASGQKDLITESLKFNKKYKNRTVWASGFENYIEGDQGIDVGDEVLVETTLKFNEGTGKYKGQTFANFSIKNIDLLESGEDFEEDDVEDVEEEDEDEDSEELD